MEKTIEQMVEERQILSTLRSARTRPTRSTNSRGLNAFNGSL